MRVFQKPGQGGAWALAFKGCAVVVAAKICFPMVMNRFEADSQAATDAMPSLPRPGILCGDCHEQTLHGRARGEQRTTIMKRCSRLDATGRRDLHWQL